MGEVVVSSEEDVNLEVQGMEVETEAQNNKQQDGSATASASASSSASAVRWDRILPRMVLRVLLVEADDSTRQIIAALLRKCSYRVAAVPDGLKAWEVLKGKPHNIDLILTEVDLPSISGYALLTLIMEHDICKNIPVIMMSSEDSVNMVYRCMLRGAADFLVKPVRKNELRTLWQHVWRRQTATSGRQGPQDESVAQLKVEATAENDAASNHSSGYMACIERNRECIEKGSDAQSSCTKPDLEPEKTCAENMQDFSQPSCKKPPAIDVNIQKYEELTKSSRKLFKHTCADNGLEVGACKDFDTMTRGEDVAHESPKVHSNIIIEPCVQPLANSSREAIDLIGTLGSSSLNNGTNDRDSSPPLDLSLRRSYPSGSINQVSDERHPLNHSEASAFSRYINRALRPQHSSASTCNQQKDYGTSSGRQLSIHTPDYNSGTDVLTPKSEKSILSMVTGRAEVAFPHPQRAVIPVSVPVTGLGFGGLSTAYGSVVPTKICPQSRQSTVQDPGSACHLEPSFRANAFHPSNLKTRNCGQFHDLIDQNRSNSINQTEHKQMHALASPGDPNHISSAGDQSASNSLWNGTASHLNNIGGISNANIDQVAVGQTTAASGNEGGLPMHDRSCHRSVQREAALTKFRLKRKDRCYEKKVRYESRKKLAEQRPRVKGQFVRQVHTDSAPVQTDNHSGNSLDG